ncbi:MAG: hypothetical protein EP326_12095 [Deltaproteobacteria bacterium]|nr:MAG: hypothetical protein EP326_12095 [Deltaproteobacteria bacterium]TNF31983.1 MAG: hypothetical protein EP319_00620 [Deltaproteobacteria bacterium]
MMRSPCSGRTKLFRTGLTRNLFREFLSSYQVKGPVIHSTPFVYVDCIEEGSVKLLSSLLETSNDVEEILAVTVLSGGDLEVLTTE